MGRKKEHLIPLEKSKKVIYLEKRGRKRRGMSVFAVIFGVLGLLCLLYCLIMGLFVNYGTRFFLVWGALGVFFGGIAFVLARRNLLERLPMWLKLGAVFIFAVGILVFALVEGMILSRFSSDGQNGADYLIVLGAQWREDGPSYLLKKRLDQALEYLEENPQTRVIVSGGQGSNEPVSEAEGMYGYLVEAGIRPERILLETESKSTRENLAFSGELLDKAGDRVVIVTNNFHVFRAVKIAEKLGYEQAEGLAAGSYPLSPPNNMLREFFGVLKDFAVGNL